MNVAGKEMRTIWLAPDSTYARTFRDIAARVWQQVSGETPARRAAPRIIVE